MPSFFEFTDPPHLGAWARGQPGQRTFYLSVGRSGYWLRAWMEKEQLEALGLAAGRLLLQLPKHAHLLSQEGPELSTEEPPEPTVEEFRVGQLGLGYDEAQDRFLLVFHDAEAKEDSDPVLVCRTSGDRLWALSRRILAVCMAGRPRCHLCGGPIDPEGHVCPKGNGHRLVEML